MDNDDGWAPQGSGNTRHATHQSFKYQYMKTPCESHARTDNETPQYSTILRAILCTLYTTAIGATDGLLPLELKSPTQVLSARLPRRPSPPSHCRYPDNQSRLERKRSTDAAIPSGSSGASTSSTAATAKKSAASEARGGAGGSAAKTSMSSASKPDAKQGGAGKAPGGDADEREVEGVPNETLFVGNLSYK